MKEKGKGVKMRNFTKEEDLFLSKAYVRVSLDPIRGNDRKSQDFWAHIFRTFVTIYKAEAEVQEDDMADRNVDSIKSRFQRNIQKDVMEFCAICRTNELKSGESEEDFFGRMDRIFEQQTNKTFRFRHCLPVLQEIPKFDWETRGNSNVDVDAVADDFLNNSVVGFKNTSDKQYTPEPKSYKKSSFVNNASTLKRPQGTKAAKRKVVEEYLDGKVEEKKMRILQDVASGLNDMAEVLQRKQYREHLQAMLMIHQSLGNQQQMLAYLSKLEALTVDPSHRPSRSDEVRDVVLLDDTSVDATPNGESNGTAEEDLSHVQDKELQEMIRELQEE